MPPADLSWSGGESPPITHWDGVRQAEHQTKNQNCRLKAWKNVWVPQLQYYPSSYTRKRHDPKRQEAGGYAFVVKTPLLWTAIGERR